MACVDKTLIVGGGIAGLTLAASLHQRGFEAELIERSTCWNAVGAGMSVQANAMRVLRALGMDADVERAGTVLRRWSFCDQQGEMLFDVDLELLWEGVGPCIGIERAKLQRILVAGAAAAPCRLGTTIASLHQDGRRVSVEFSDGSTGQYDLIIGADGISSTVRRLTLSADPPANAGHMAWRSLAPIRPEGLTNLRFFLGDRCFFGLCPVGNGHTYGFGHVSELSVHDEMRGRLERLRKRFAEFATPIQEYLAALECDEQIHCSTVEWVQEEEWYTGRVLLIGDAAHASSPMMGQGGCMAIEDAYVLAEVLRSAATVESALEAYVIRRKPRVKWVQQESRAVSESIRLPPETRNAVLRARGEETFERRFRPLMVAP
jgi:2-polyprenyl-6-methoxyphenol hydroxylase-like FAD-dependent oxidoreductase